MKEFIVKESPTFILRVKRRPCLKPEGLYSFEFINEEYKDGKLTSSSTYNFFMDEAEIHRLSESLVK